MSRAHLLYVTLLLLVVAAHGSPRALRRLTGCQDESCGETDSQAPGVTPPQTAVAGSPSQRAEPPEKNSLCALPKEGDPPMPGGFTPMAVEDVPGGYGELAAKAYIKLEGKFRSKKKRRSWWNCDEFKANVLESCSQIVAGTNYNLLVDVYYCKKGNVTNDWNNATLVATVLKPLPYLNEPPSVIEVTCISCTQATP